MKVQDYCLKIKKVTYIFQLVLRLGKTHEAYILLNRI